MTADPTVLHPAPSNWFHTAIEYEGLGRAEFLDPQGAAVGPVQIRFDEFGETFVQMNVEKVESPRPLQFGLMELLSGNKPVRKGDRVELGFGGPKNQCVQLRVDVPQGVFSARKIAPLGYSFGTAGAKLNFYPLSSQIDCAPLGTARYWAMSLVNFLSEFSQQHPELDRHPLRIYPTPIIPERLPEDMAQRAQLLANSKNRLIVFEFRGKPAFIEPLPDYSERKEQLLSGRERGLITAIMVGDLSLNPIDDSGIEEWEPLDFLRLLGLATGTEVGSAWIEFRDVHGGLVRRIHANAGERDFRKGRAAIDEGLSRGTGRLLTTAQMSPAWGQPYLRAVLKHTVQSGFYQLNLENAIDHLCRALDCLCEKHGCSSQYLMKELSPHYQSLVRDALEEADQKVRRVAQAAISSGEPGHARLLDKIAARVRNAANKDVAFGLAVAALLDHFGLPDADIVDAYYHTHPRADGIKTWSSVLSHYRGQVVHSGFFEILAHKHEADDIVTIIYHLHDILVRIALNLLGYDGTYSPIIPGTGHTETVDWVKPDTPAARLGYK